MELTRFHGYYAAMVAKGVGDAEDDSTVGPEFKKDLVELVCSECCGESVSGF